jgi:WD40 repeat protein
MGRDLPPGRAKPLKIMSEDFTLYRGEVGAVHAVAFRPDGLELAVASGDEGRGEVRLWDLSGLHGDGRGSPPP